MAESVTLATPLRVLVLCTSNICRSPLAAALLRAALPPTCTVTSSGLWAWDGREASTHSVKLAARRLGGNPLRDHRSTELTHAILDAADAIFIMEPWQAESLVETYPSTANRLSLWDAVARTETGIAAEGKVDTRAERGASRPVPVPVPSAALQRENPKAAAHLQRIAAGCQQHASTESDSAQPEEAYRGQHRGRGVPDPIGGSQATYEHMCDRLEKALPAVLAHLQEIAGRKAHGAV